MDCFGRRVAQHVSDTVELRGLSVRQQCGERAGMDRDIGIDIDIGIGPDGAARRDALRRGGER
jgi:hypothetical protein